VPDHVLPHLSANGEARMVDVSDKAVTARSATAGGTVLLTAGIQGAKRTPDLIPLCHPLFLSGVDVTTDVTDAGVEIRATVRTTDRTGVEMEALTAVSVAALAVVDMVKAIDRGATITDVRVLAKSGGRRGDWRRDDHPGEESA
jgi:cyclic pyranopterin phosphate synthase